ncbi:MAG TPA: hypothetical protein ENN33_02765 [Ignavibacteria bacterium]|nr:hypothetical protein [Ignavibacteria bacterium]
MYLIPTIDVEAIDNLKTQGSFDQLILGTTNQGQWGVPKIMRVLKDNSASASFFVDFAEFPKYSKKFKVLINDLSNNNFDVQLHIHPQFCADIKRPLMQHYTFEEQVKIIKQCQLYYHECCKTQAIAVVKDLLNEVKRFNGFFVMLWRNSYFDEVSHRGITKFYEELLEFIAHLEPENVLGKELMEVKLERE